ncbi:MAG: hypothetical protein HQL32_10805, partial [Planctomycetes bacterium]|nr:hypothetical protein [Planctomycetota bacterium]
DFIRTQKESLYILEGAEELQDYFLASVLPLYVDLGKVEQGAKGRASLRLSFEGRNERKVHFTGGDKIICNAGGESFDFPWAEVGLPESVTLLPSQPFVFNMTFSVPQNQPLGSYGGSIALGIGDQEILIPVDFQVIESSVSRRSGVGIGLTQVKPQQIELPLTLPSLEMEPLIREDAPIKDRVMPKMEIAPTESLLTKIKDKEEPKVVEAPAPLPPKDLSIRFSVTPEEVPTFQVVEGQFASMKYTFINKSSHSGVIDLTMDGFGELDADELTLDAGASVDVYWSWDVDELDERAKLIDFYFKSGEHTVKRSLRWDYFAQLPPTFFYITISILLLLTLYYGVKYFFTHESKDLFLSASSATHLLLALLAFRSMIPPRAIEEEKEPELVHFEIEEIESQEVLVEKTPDEEESKSDQPTESTEDMQEIVVKKAPQVKVDEPMPMTFSREIQVNVQRVDSKIPEITQESRAIPLQEVERVMENERDGWDLKPELDIKVAKIESVNDRPFRRAVMQKRQEREETPHKLVVQRNENESAVDKAKFTPKTIAQSKPENIDLEVDRQSEKGALVVKKTEAKMLDKSQLIDKELKQQGDQVEKIDLASQGKREIKSQDLSLPKDSSIVVDLQKNRSIAISTEASANPAYVPALPALGPRVASKLQIDMPDVKMEKAITQPSEEIVSQEVAVSLELREQDEKQNTYARDVNMERMDTSDSVNREPVYETGGREMIAGDLAPQSNDQLQVRLERQRSDNNVALKEWAPKAQNIPLDSTLEIETEVIMENDTSPEASVVLQDAQERTSEAQEIEAEVDTLPQTLAKAKKQQAKVGKSPAKVDNPRDTLAPTLIRAPRRDPGMSKKRDRKYPLSLRTRDKIKPAKLDTNVPESKP